MWTLVTGAGREGRIGAKIAERFAGRGSNIYLHYRSNPEEAERVKQNVQRAGSKKTRVELVSGELSNLKDVAALFENISPDIVILNAAIFKPSDTHEDGSLLTHLERHENAFESNVRANAKAALLVTEAALFKAQKEKKKTIVVFVGDAFIDKGGVYPENLEAYTVSKAYIPSLVRQYAQNYGKKGFRFLAILNGPIEPPPTAPKESVEKMREEIALPDTDLDPWIGGEKVAEAIDYLLQSKAVNGAAVAVDGGRSWTTHKEH